MNVFYNRCTLRPSCHKCPFATTERKTDITIGDFWRIEKTILDFFDPEGTSLFLIHTNHGEELFDNIKEHLEYRLSNTKQCWQANLEVLLRYLNIDRYFGKIIKEKELIIS